jgi:hypothetical protein
MGRGPSRECGAQQKTNTRGSLVVESINLLARSVEHPVREGFIDRLWRDRFLRRVS